MQYRIFILLYFIFHIAHPQQKTITTASKPKLIVGIVVDQMRYDYLTRFYAKLSNGGFKRMINNGFLFKNHQISYLPTTTAPGHASIYTGTTPKNHGIIGNSWFDRKKRKKIYCVADRKMSPIGTGSRNDGSMSPVNLKVSTITDQNRLHTEMRGKTISIALKDRGAILPGGHTANAAYWFRGKDQGSWISSSYYNEKLPKWVIDFNESDIIDNYLTTWNTLLKIDTYWESGKDDNSFERGFRGKNKPIFPYNLALLKESNGNYDIIRSTPFGNSLTVDFSIAALREEKLGVDNDTDFLTISFSSTDYIGHNFGVNSKEVQDTYLRLDKDLERLLNALDKHVGIENYVLFLTSDHGANHVSKYLNSLKIPSGYFKEASVNMGIKKYIKSRYSIDSIIQNISNNQVFLNHKTIKTNNLSTLEIENNIAGYLLTLPNIDNVRTRTQLESSEAKSGIEAAINQGFNSNRSGDICYTLASSFVAYSKTGSTHGSGYNYDSHIPLIFYGFGIKNGSTLKRTKLSDIAPTIAALLGISLPLSTTGEILNEIVVE